MPGDEKIKQIEYFKNWVEVIAILLAAPWALYNFYFDKILTPANEPPYLNISSHHAIQGEKDSFYIVRSTILIKNSGKIRSVIHAGCFNLTAFRVQPNLAGDQQYAKLIEKYIDEAPGIPRYYEDSCSVINAGKLVEDGWRMDPGEEYSRSFLSMVPKNRFEALRFYAEVYASRKVEDKLSIKWQVDNTGTINLELHKMPENELLDSKKHGALIKKLGLGRSYNMEEIAIAPVLIK